MHVVITGGTGFIGSFLVKTLWQQGHEVTVIGRSSTGETESRLRFVRADLVEGEVPSIIAECDAVIHLMGAPLFHRWTKEYKQKIFDSRVRSAKAMYAFLEKQQRRPRIFISASGAGFYGDRGEETLEETSSPGGDFPSMVCQQWEEATKRFSSLGIRTVSIRTGTVLSVEGGALPKLRFIFRLGLGGKLGNGKQWFPWIHIEDLIRIYLQALSDDSLSGPVNGVAPGLIQNAEFTKVLASALQRPACIPIPAFLLRVVLGEFATILLSSQKVVPGVLQALPFSFLYPDPETALRKELSD